MRGHPGISAGQRRLVLLGNRRQGLDVCGRLNALGPESSRRAKRAEREEIAVGHRGPGPRLLGHM